MKAALDRLRHKMMIRIVNFYEGWIIPPQRESLFEIKKRELAERTKYLNPKLLYTLSEEEKNGKSISYTIRFTQ